MPEDKTNNKYYGLKVSGKTKRYVVNRNGDIYLCYFVTFHDDADTLYAELPESYADTEKAKDYPYGWWNYELTYATVREAKHAAIYEKKMAAIRQERVIEEKKRAVKVAEDKLERIKEEISQMEGGEFTIVDATKGAK